jgi:hypothetical protein
MPHLKISLCFENFSSRVLDCLTSEGGTDRMSRNDGNLTTNLLCVTYHMSEYLKKDLIVVIGEAGSIER